MMADFLWTEVIASSKKIWFWYLVINRRNKFSICQCPLKQFSQGLRFAHFNPNCLVTNFAAENEWIQIISKLFNCPHMLQAAKVELGRSGSSFLDSGALPFPFLGHSRQSPFRNHRFWHLGALSIGSCHHRKLRCRPLNQREPSWWLALQAT